MTDLEQEGSVKQHSMMRWVVRRTFWLVAMTIIIALAGDWVGRIDNSGAIISTAFLALGAITGAKAWQKTAEK